MAGEAQRGLQQIESSMELRERSGTQLGRPLYLAMWAEAHLRSAQPEKALSLVETALKQAANSGERVHKPYLCMVAGNAARQCGEQRVAAAWLARAARIATRQGAPLWVLRAHRLAAELAAQS